MLNELPLILDSRGVLTVVWLVLGMAYATPVMSADTDPHAKAQIEYSRDPGTMLVSFREIFPEFADQDPTPLVRIYGDGRVAVFFASYMKRAGQYEMLISSDELEALLLQLTPVLLNFDEEDVRSQKQAADDLLWAATSEWEDMTLIHDADAEVSIFNLNIEAYWPNGPLGQMISKPTLSRSWHGLRFDARDYIGIEPIQALMHAENTLRAFIERVELVPVESLP